MWHCYFDNNQRDDAIFYANMRGKPHWLMVVVCYGDEVYAPFVRLRLWLLALMLAACLVLVYVVRRFARGEETMESASRLLEQNTQKQ